MHAGELVVDEWGPYDYQYPKLWPVDSTRAVRLAMVVLHNGSVISDAPACELPASPPVPQSFWACTVDTDIVYVPVPE